MDRPCTRGTVTLGLGREPRSQAISASGEARFDQLPRAFEGLLVPMTITCSGFRDLASVAVLNHERPSDVVLEPLAPVCGNGHVDPGEQCDDGNRISGDGCSSTCRLEAKPVVPPARAAVREGPCSVTPGAILESARIDCSLLDPVKDKSLYDSIRARKLHKEPAYRCTAIYQCKR
jgi:cysteine-rich repeat protein